MSDTTMRPRADQGRTVALGAMMVLAGAVGVWLSWRFFVNTEHGQLLDDAAFRGSVIGRTQLWQTAEPVLDVIDGAFVVLVVGTAAVIAVLRRRWWLAIHVAILVGGANVTTQMLKHVVFDRPAYVDNIDNSLPSGHTTVAASAAVALVFVVPAAAKSIAALVGAGYTAVTGVSTMIGGWHRPSDVVAAIAVVLLWSGVAVLFGAEQPQRQDTGTSPVRAVAATVTALLAAAALVAGVLAIGALMRTRELVNASGTVSDRSDLLTAYVGGAFGVISVTAVLFAAVLAAGTLVGGATRDQSTATDLK